MNTGNDQIAVQKLLHRKFEELRAKNPRVSIRAFAKRLGISAGAANEILRGERRVSAKMAAKLSQKLLLDPTERAQLLSEFPERVRRKRNEVAQASQRAEALRLTADQFHAIAEWTHFAILSLMRTEGFCSDPAWIGERLGIRADAAAASVQRLIRLGLVERESESEGVIANGRDSQRHPPLRRTAARIGTTDDVQNLAIQRLHLEDLERVARCVRELPVALRDVSSLTIPADPRLLPEAKVILRQAQDEIEALMEGTPGTEVYRVMTCLFPLTQVSPSSTIPKSLKPIASVNPVTK